MKATNSSIALNIQKPNWKLIAGIPALIFFCCYLITLSTAFKNNNQALSIAITGDLLITAPLICLFLIRKTAVSKTTALRVFFLGIVAAGLIINTGSDYIIQVLKIWISPFVEGALIFIIARKFYFANKAAKLSRQGKIDFLNHCRKVLTTITGNKKLSAVLSSEVAVFYYAFIGKKEKNIDNIKTFTSYKTNGVILVLSTFLALFLIETIGVHFLFTLWSTALAWIFTGLSLYTCLQLFAHIKSIRIRVAMINEKNIELHMGLAADAYIGFDNIENIEISTKQFCNTDAVKIALIKGLENHNMIIRLKEPVEIIKIYGIKKQAKTILFFVDEPGAFLNSVNLKLQRN